MKIQTTYQLEPGDTIYLVTETGAIKTIRLTKDHFSLVNKVNPDYSYFYKHKQGMLHEIKGKYFWKADYQEKNSLVYLTSDKVKGPKARIQLYRVYDNSNYVYSKTAIERIDTEEYPVFAYTDHELAKAKAKKVISRNVKDDIAYEIRSIVIRDADDMLIMTYDYDDIDIWDDYTDIVSNYEEESVFIKINSRTRTQKEFEAYVKRQIKKAVKDANI